MTVVTVREAESRLGGLIDLARLGEDIVITRDDIPVARLVPEAQPRVRRLRGSARGLLLHMAGDFDAPLADFREHAEAAQ